MKVILSKEDKAKLARIEEIRKTNFRILDLYSNLLNFHPDFITKEMIESVKGESDLPIEYAYHAILSAAFELDEEKSNEDKTFSRLYLLPSIKCLDINEYRNFSYYKNISFPDISISDWRLKTNVCKPYECFIYNDIVLSKNFMELPRLGFFEEEFTFPAVYENGREWMTLMPNEIETMKKAVDEAYGKVITFGLGLGCYAYMVSEKENVDSITIIEKNENVIKIFNDYILPQFPNKGKVRVIKSDAFEYVKNEMKNECYDVAFADLWHDVSDGFDMYLSFKRLEYKNKNTKWLYWIEDSLISKLRWIVFAEIRDSLTSGEKAFDGEKVITSFAEIEKIMSTEELKKLACDIRPIKLQVE